MDRLWAPWRLAYAATPKPAGTPECFVCRVAAAADDRENLVVRRTAHSVVILNRFPYNNGHLLLCPSAHKADPADLTDAETLDLQHLIAEYCGSLRQLLKAEGFNVGLNLGKSGGAGLPGHLHWHVVPRWAGDANFMAVTADTRVIVQSLEALFELLTTPPAEG